MRLKLFQPKQRSELIQDLDLRGLKAHGIKGLILDLDDTIVPRKVNNISPEIMAWVKKAKEDFPVCIVSNSILRPHKVLGFAKTLGVPALALAFKPLPFGFWWAFKTLKTRPKETAIIGDQIFSDILGGNLLGLHTVLVKYQTPETFWPRKLMRWLESLVNPEAG